MSHLGSSAGEFLFDRGNQCSESDWLAALFSSPLLLQIESQNLCRNTFLLTEPTKIPQQATQVMRLNLQSPIIYLISLSQQLGSLNDI